MLIERHDDDDYLRPTLMESLKLFNQIYEYAVRRFPQQFYVFKEIPQELFQISVQLSGKNLKCINSKSMTGSDWLKETETEKLSEW